ncbi:serine hydrolase domain-containing protein [Algoriphagus pacificus]|uniref:Beta-lactamase family protein n=1 Tax=Algoriphagus pacificus TaxID=2811234 RepID=A0ABS3CLJ0_9BACT|nr:serine hydrolase domain-containing protein [Algoriphagus pacificus]MBN7817969.1 beta-lactamase family protein [Algoriphagus pacificus]
MKVISLLLRPVFIFLILFSCTSKPEESSYEEKSTTSFSSTYQPPIFKNDQRKEKIEGIAPQLQKLMEDYAKQNNIPGIAYGIVVDNELVVSDAVGFLEVSSETPATTTAAYRIASMSKSFTAMAILKLRDEGKLSLHDPVSKYIPEFDQTTYLTKDSPIIDIENLITMTAGFPEDNPWGDRQLDEPNQMLLDLMSDGLSLSNPPSLYYEYSNTGFAMLGYIIEQVSGKPYQAYIKDEILSPLGMTHSYWEIDEVPTGELVIGYRWEDEEWKLEPMLHDGAFGSMGGLITSIEDFSKYVSFHLSAWPPRSEEESGPIKRSSLREMHTPQFPRLYPNATNYNDEPCPRMAGYGYGLGIYQDCNNRKWVSHGGALPGFGSNYVFYPEYGVGIMAFCNLTYTTPWPLKEIEKILFNELGIQPRTLPVSTILETRKEQVAKIFMQETAGFEVGIFAENFFLDQDKDHRTAGLMKVLDQAGKINSTTELEPQNQLRGTFKLIGEKGDILVFFTLTPEKDPKVQQLDYVFQEK